MRYVPEKQANGHVATILVQQVLLGTIIRVNLRKYGQKVLINGACMICMVMFGSGFQIITVTYITLKLRKEW